MRRRHRNLLGHRDFSVRLLLDGWRRRVPACRPIRHEFIDEAAQDISHDVLHGNHVKRATSAKVPSRTRDRASRSSCTPRAGRFSAFFHAGAAAADANDYIVYNQATGFLSYDADGNGSHAAISFAVLTNHVVLNASDFVVI